MKLARLEATAARAVAMTLLLTTTGLHSAAAPAPRGDGWHGWEVDAVDEAPSWCCYSWRGDRSVGAGCDLDDGHHGYGSSDHGARTTSKISVYVRIGGGEVRDIRAVAANCPVHSAEGIEWLGRQPADDSVAWLRKHVSPRLAVSSAALAAIAVHAGDAATDALHDTARSDRDVANRKDAVFWMGQARAHASGGELRRIMFRDRDPKLREHAAFSWSQADVPERGEALRELAMSDVDTRVRSRAWFWLAQTGDAGAADAIFAGLRVETSRSVRDQAIFALSQLPEERGVDALVRVVEDRELEARDRRQAIFWLAQSDSPRALGYLAEVLD